jgi:hypothetical protein
MAKTRAGGQRHVDWFAAGLGLVAAVVLEVLVTSTSGTRLNGVGASLLTFGALCAGGLLAGLVDRYGSPWNGIVTAIGFILVAQLVATVAPVAPLGGRLDMVGLIVQDILILAGGTLGGLCGGGLRRAAQRGGR